MTERRYDGAYAPTQAQFHDLYSSALAQGQQPQFAGYLGGPRVFHAWSAQDFANGRAAGFDMSGVYVGLQAADFNALTGESASTLGAQHGRDAVALAHGVGLPAGSRLALDVEAGAAGPVAVAYANAFAAAVRDAAYRPELYGLPSFVQSAGAAFDAIWAADYENADPATSNTPGVAVDAGHRAWQWRNSHSEAGANVDTSDADTDTQEPNRMTSDQDIARGHVYAVRAALLGDGPGSPDEAAAIEAYVAGTVANVESGLSALIAACQADPRYLPGRVAALEAWAKSQAAEQAAPAPAAAAVNLGPLSDRVSALEAFRAAVRSAVVAA